MTSQTPESSGLGPTAWGRACFAALPFVVSLAMPLLACDKSTPDKAEETAQAGEGAPASDAPPKQTKATSAKGPKGPKSPKQPKQPSIASSVGGASKKTVKKTEAVEREAADLGASHTNARIIAEDERLQSLVDDAAGKTLHVPKGALDHFYAQLATLPQEPTPAAAEGQATADGPQVVRVLHIGDSFIGQDVFPHAIRRRMQARFGDAGPGFQLADIHHRSNISRALELRSQHFRSAFVRDAGHDDAGNNNLGLFGYGGHVARGGPGATSWMHPRDPAPFAAGAGHAEVWYQMHPLGAQLEVAVGETVKNVDTRADTVSDAWVRVPLTTPEAELKITVRGKGRLFVYGAVLETGQPGVVWDTAVHTATFTNRVLSQDPKHFAGQIAHREVDLLVFNFGGNDLRRVANGNLSQEAFAAEIGEVIDLYKLGRPQMSCLVVSSTDHGKSGRTTVLPKHVETVVGAQRAAAAAKGCAFFDSLAVFGGVGVAKTWAKRKHPLVGRDLSHLTALGREVLADVLVGELVRNRPSSGSADVPGEATAKSPSKPPTAPPTDVAPASPE